MYGIFIALNSAILVFAQQSVSVYEVQLYTDIPDFSTPFYKSKKPFLFEEGLYGVGMSDPISIFWQKFDGWTNKFHYRHFALDSAEAINNDGEIVAKAKFSEYLQEGLRRFREIHYNSQGGVQFECISTFEYVSVISVKIEILKTGYKSTGYFLDEVRSVKIEERILKGKKLKEYFFILPLYGDKIKF